MQVVITGRQLNVGDQLRGHAEKQLADVIAKYFDQAIEASVVFSLEGSGKQVRSDISVHVGRNIKMHGHAEAFDAKASFDVALERLAKQLRRQKRRLRDHQNAEHDSAAEEAP